MVRLGNTQFLKLEFFAAFQTMRNQTFKPSIICHAFKITKIVLFNLEAMLEKIHKKQTKLQAVAGSRTFFLKPLLLNQCTSQSSNSIIKYGEKLQKMLARGGFNAIIAPVQFEQFIRRSITNVFKLQLIDQDLKAIQKTTTARQI